ncbi:MAG: hypothetical protein RSA20_06670, partial [Oscillospiraceae bacterium]
MLKLIKIFLFTAIFVALMPLLVFADTNVDGGGGDMGEGTGKNIWHVGDDGVRITVVRDSDNVPVSQSINFSNIGDVTVDFHGGLIDKVSYNGGRGFILRVGNNFKKSNIDVPLPQIISGSGGANIPAIKSYFSDETIIKYICSKLNFNYDKLTGGDYKLLIEPMAYFTYNGRKYAFTAQEASYFNQKQSGKLRAAMGNLTSKNLPLSMFLEVSDLGIPAWGGTKIGFVSDSDIQSFLGCAVVKFAEKEPDPPPVPAGSFVYRTNTTVYTSVRLHNTSEEDISPDDKAEVTITIGGVSHTQSFIIPPIESTLVWVKWDTPSTPQELPITVWATNGAQPEYTTSTAVIQELTEKTPPDPKATDLKPGFTLPKLPKQESVKKLSWGKWIPRWAEKFEEVEIADCAVFCDDACKEKNGCAIDCALKHYESVDKGNWEYEYDQQTAQLVTKVDITPAVTVPTAYKNGLEWVIKSGYGINLQPEAVTSSGGMATPAQNAVALFPEFNYKTYNRVFENGYRRNIFQFKKNNWSYSGGNMHFTPIWFPRQMNRYEPLVCIFDVWTPAGQL